MYPNNCGLVRCLVNPASWWVRVAADAWLPDPAAGNKNGSYSWVRHPDRVVIKRCLMTIWFGGGIVREVSKLFRGTDISETGSVSSFPQGIGTSTASLMTRLSSSVKWRAPLSQIEIPKMMNDLK